MKVKKLYFFLNLRIIRVNLWYLSECKTINFSKLINNILLSLLYGVEIFETSNLRNGFNLQQKQAGIGPSRRHI